MILDFATPWLADWMGTMVLYLLVLLCYWGTGQHFLLSQLQLLTLDFVLDLGYPGLKISITRGTIIAGVGSLHGLTLICGLG